MILSLNQLMLLTGGVWFDSDFRTAFDLDYTFKIAYIA